MLMKKQHFSSLWTHRPWLRGIVCTLFTLLTLSIGDAWAETKILWSSDFIEAISGVTQQKGRSSDSWGTTASLDWAKSTYNNCFNAGGSGSTLTAYLLGGDIQQNTKFKD